MGTGRLCASVSAKTSAECLELIAEAETVADLIEIRFDHLSPNEVPVLLDRLRTLSIQKPLIATYRSADQGGHASNELPLRRKFWEQLGNGFWGADQEEDVFDPVPGVQENILSCHDFSFGARDAQDVFERLIAKSPSVIKYAYLADDITDTILVWKMLKTAAIVSQPAVVIAMGEAGKITRILGPAYGSKWTYCSIGDSTAPGQISAGSLADLYRVRDLDLHTQVYGVIGDPVSRSLSPKLHNVAFKSAGLNSVFLPLLVKDLRGFIERMVRRSSRETDLNFAGFSVTMPHKLSIMEHLDAIDETARAIGAVNTVLIDGDLLRGYNTDAEGFIAPLLSRYGSLKNARTGIFGAGGAARACLYALKKEGASTAIFARDPEKGKELGDEFGTDFFSIGDAATGSFDILVNATPVGMAGNLEDQAPFKLEEAAQTKLVYDLVTSAEPTPLIRQARAAGLETITGVEMLVAQAVRQFEIWTSKIAPREAMQRAAEGYPTNV